MLSDGENKLLIHIYNGTPSNQYTFVINIPTFWTNRKIHNEHDKKMFKYIRQEVKEKEKQF